MLDKIKNSRYYFYAQQLRDVRVLGLVIFGFLVLLVSWSGIQVIQTNYDLQKQISKLQQQNQVQELENRNLQLRNQYYNTDQYLELAARKQFGKAAPGETVLLVPKTVALAHTTPLPQTVIKKKAATVTHKPTYQRNFESWMDFLLHREHEQP